MRLRWTCFNPFAAFALIGLTLTLAPAPAAPSLEDRVLMTGIVQYPFVELSVTTHNPDTDKIQCRQLAISQIAKRCSLSPETGLIRLSAQAQAMVKQEVRPISLHASALYFQGSFTECERLALKGASVPQESGELAQDWALAAIVAYRRGATGLALERFRNAARLADSLRGFDQWTSIQSAIAYVLESTGDIDGSLKQWRMIHDVHVKRKGAASSLALQTQNLLANALYKARRYPEAEAEFRAVLNHLAERPNLDLYQVQIIRDNLAKSIAAQGRAAEAGATAFRVAELPIDPLLITEADLLGREEYAANLLARQYRREGAELLHWVYQARLLRDGPQDSKTEIVQNNLALALQSQGRNEDAVLLLSALISAKEKRGSEDDLLLEAKDNLGLALAGMSEFAAAAEVHKKVLEARTSLLGAHHGNTLDAAMHLAQDLSGLGQYDEALSRLNPIIEERAKIQGAAHFKTLQARSARAAILKSAGRSTEAEAEYCAVAAQQRSVAEDSHVSLDAECDLAAFLSDEGRFAECRELAETILIRATEEWGPEDTVTRRCRRILEEIALHQPLSAPMDVSSTRRLLAEQQNSFGPNDLQTLKTRTLLAGQLRRLKRYPDAATEYEAVLAGYRRQTLQDHPDALAARNDSALNLHLMGRSAEAEKQIRLLLPSCISILGEEDSTTIQCRANLAIILFGQGQYQEAFDLQKEALMDMAQLSKPDHPNFLNLYLQASQSCRMLGRMDDWRVYFQRARDIAVKIYGDESPQVQMFDRSLADPASR